MILRYTYLLVEQKGKYFYENEHLKQTHDTLESVNCFSSIGIEYRSFFPVKIKTKPCIVLLRRKLGFGLQLDENNRQIDANTVDTRAKTDVSNEIMSDLNDTKKDDEIEPALEPETTVDDAKEWDLIDANKTMVAINELEKPTKNTKLKIKRFIETHFRATDTYSVLDNEPAEQAVPAHKRSAKTSIRNIIKSERIKEIADKISQMDLKSMCDLENDSVKSCLIKIIDGQELD